MKKQWLALLMAAMLLALVGCGEKKDSARDSDDKTNDTTTQHQDTVDGSTESRSRTSYDSNGDTAFENNHGSTFGGAGEEIQDAARTPETVYDSMTRQSANGMATWRQMLENGFVHDSDGFLLDGENACWS